MERTAHATLPVVLVVDDDHDTTDSLALLLGLWGYRPLVAYDGQTALAAVSDGCVAAVIDLALPGMDGYQLLCRLRALPQLSGAVFIAVSGYGREEDVRRCQAAGFDYHLLKPCDPDKLRRLLPPVPDHERPQRRPAECDLQCHG
jgi:CheY-like chemotaxis protein